MYSIFGFISTQIIVQNRWFSSQKKFWSDFVHFFENWTNLEIWSVLKLPLQICCSKRDIKIFVSIFIFFCRFLNRNYFWYLNHMCSNVFSPKKTQGISLKSTLFQNCSYLPLFFSITRTISSLTVDWNNFGNKIPFLFSSLWRKRFMIFNSFKTTQPNPDFYSIYFRLECDHLNIQFIPLCDQNGFRLFKRGTRKQWQVFRHRVRFENTYGLWKHGDRVHMCWKCCSNTMISKLGPVFWF